MKSKLRTVFLKQECVTRSVFIYLTKTTSCASGSEKLLAMYQKKSP